jgi:hypothetical protein
VSTISEIEMLSDRVVGLAARVTELEQQLADADTLAERLRVTAHEVLDAAGASDLERLRLSVPMVKLQAFLAAALARPSVQGQAEREFLAAHTAQSSPVLQAKIEREYVERPTGKIIDLGMRRRNR